MTKMEFWSFLVIKEEYDGPSAGDFTGRDKVIYVIWL